MMTREQESRLGELIYDTIHKYYEDGTLWFNYVREEENEKYLIDIKFKEGFIIALQGEKFAKFRWELNTKLNKVFSDWCREAYKCKRSGCHLCVDQKPYKIQFSEEL